MQFKKYQYSDFPKKIPTLQKVSDFLELNSESDLLSSKYSSRLESQQKPSLSASQVRSEMLTAIAQLFPHEQQEVAEKFYRNLPQEELAQLQLLSHTPSEMTTEDISAIVAYTYSTNPNLFQEILAQQPRLIHLLSNHFVSAILGIMAAKWLNSSIKKMKIT